MRRTVPALLVASVAAVAGCGDDDSDERSERPQARTDAATEPAPERPRARGTTISLDDSEFGTMLFGPRRQAIYIFERDSRGKTVCYGDCAEAWPPVFTRGEPVAGRGVRRALLGTVRRRDGRLQVTYAGKPLYYYAHEGPGEVRCHNVNLNGGLWWVVGPDGRRRA